MATKLQVKSVFVGMFYELDEGTQILKVSPTPPKEAYDDISYEGMPSDVYLCWGGKGTSMIKGDEVPYNETKPDCPRLTQPTVPSRLALPAEETNQQDREGEEEGRFRWDPALSLAGGGSISHYQVMVNGEVRETSHNETLAVNIGCGRVGGVTCR